MQSLDLSSLSWSLRGWHPLHWRLSQSMELGHTLASQVGPIPANVPGSVQKALLDAEIIPDWNISTNSLAAEWVENRHWTYETTLPLEWCRKPARKVLHCEGLDHAGEIWCGGSVAGEFNNAFVPWRFDLSQLIEAFLQKHPEAPGVPLTIAFTDSPRYLGQVNYTSRIRDWKPRFYYVWDWTIRLVQIGIWDSLRLEIDEGAGMETCRVYSEYSTAESAGKVRALVRAKAQGPCQLVARLSIGKETLAESIVAVQAGHEQEVLLSIQNPEVWWPACMGRQTLYDLRVELRDAAGTVCDLRNFRVGFREITWKHCEGSPANAEPWLLHVNGRPVFILGANWVPIRPNFADVTDELYETFVRAYADHGFNFLRVWGGAQMEKEVFYRLCDELGILVWQEFPLSSSGIDNWPPEDEGFCNEIAAIARSYVERRQHHPSLIMWCGGNELQFGTHGERVGGGLPLGYDHPPIAAMKKVVEQFDPTRRFVPTSSSGPKFFGDEKDFGKGLHHDVHGPWNIPGTLEEWKAYWDADDALIRSEVGVPGASSAEMIRAYCQDEGLPANLTHPAWRHVAGWWIQWEAYLKEGGSPESLDAYVHWSQERQASAISYVVNACRKRFPRCGGVILWMGHDCFPCPVNTAVFDFKGKPKPAASAIQAAAFSW